MESAEKRSGSSIRRPGPLARFAALCVFWAATSLVVSAQTLTTLHNFTGAPDGQGPYTGTSLTQGRDGNLWGSTLYGGTYSYGTIFRISPDGALKIFSFDSTNAGYSDSGPLLGTNGLFYGTADGYPVNDGRVYSLVPATGAITVLHNFDSSDGRTPDAPLVLGPGGSYYGTTGYGGAYDDGNVYTITPSGVFTVLQSFSGADGTTPQGGGLLLGPGGALYGVTNYGGASGYGTIFRISASGAFKTVYNFDGPHGAYPQGTLILANDGNVYGTAIGGGDFSLGTVFQLTPTGTVTVLHSFSGTDGQNPYAGLIQATDGNLYGTTTYGGSMGYGTIFSITTAGAFTNLYNFDDLHGAQPNYLTQHTNGKLYGTTLNGGGANDGTVFSFDVGLGPFVTFVVPLGKVGSTAQILGTGLTGATSVTFNGVPASSFAVHMDSYMTATVPAGATTGTVQVITPTSTLSSNVQFRIVP